MRWTERLVLHTELAPDVRCMLSSRTQYMARHYYRDQAWGRNAAENTTECTWAQIAAYVPGVSDVHVVTGAHGLTCVHGVHGVQACIWIEVRMDNIPFEMACIYFSCLSRERMLVMPLGRTVRKYTRQTTSILRRNVPSESVHELASGDNCLL